jgi:hypothetical protein
MNLQESIRRILREDINESTFFRRRVDMSLMEKEFFENLNLITSLYLRKYIDEIDFNFETFEDHVIHYFMDGYYNDLTNGGENDYPVDEVYEFLLNYFHKKIKDRYETFFGRNINESIRRILKEETGSIKNLNESKSSQYLKLISNLLEPFKEKVCICDIRVTFDVEENYYNIYLVFSQKELHEKFFNLYGIRSYIQKMMNEVKMELESFLPIRNIFIGYYTTPNCEWSPLNESENGEEKKIQKNLRAIRQLLDTIDVDELCEMWVEYNPEDGDYEIRSKTTVRYYDMEDMAEELGYIEDTIRSWKLKTYVFSPYYVENCEDEIEYLNESENKKSGLLRAIEEDGLYEVITSTSLHIHEIEQKVGQLSREVLERFIIDVVKEHSVIDEDGQTYVIDLDSWPLDPVPVGNNEYVEELKVTKNELFFVVSHFEEDKYGELEFSSKELIPSNNLEYDNIYEIAGQMGFLLSKGLI